jgi:hypothetical protein
MLFLSAEKVSQGELCKLGFIFGNLPQAAQLPAICVVFFADKKGVLITSWSILITFQWRWIIGLVKEGREGGRTAWVRIIPK